MTNQERLLSAIEHAPGAKLGFIKGKNGKVVFTCDNPVDFNLIRREAGLAYTFGTKGLHEGKPSWVARPSLYEKLMSGDLVCNSNHMKKAVQL